jgi:hypothetical protein
MVNVTNLLRNRPVKVRSGKNANPPDALITIGVGETKDVEGFDAKDTFHNGLIERGDIAVGGRGAHKETSQSRGDDLKAALETAQTAVKNAEDKLTAAKAAREAEGGDTNENKKAQGDAQAELRVRRADLAKAEDAFSKG